MEGRPMTEPVAPTGEKIFFVIERGAGGKEVAGIYYDLLEPHLTRKVARDQKGVPMEQSPIIYILRVDKLDETAQKFWLSKSTKELLETYHWLKNEGTLPSSNLADSPKEKPPSGRQLGDWWTQPSVSWDSKAPPNPDYSSFSKKDNES
jgi:hypothetical protein